MNVIFMFGSSSRIQILIHYADAVVVVVAAISYLISTGTAQLTFDLNLSSQ